MTEREKNFPTEANLGKSCRFWNMGCRFPKTEIRGRTSCEGIIDDVCLFLKDGRRPKSLTEEQIRELKLRAPSLIDRSYIPPGDIIK